MRIPRIVSLVVLVVAATPAFGQDKLATPFTTAAAGNAWQNRIAWQPNLGPSGTWWRNQRYITMLSLTTDQQKKMDDVFQQSRVKLIDLKASLDKEEAILEPLMKAERLDEVKVAIQIDKVADARAELEKANARMLLGIRQLLTPEQWATLNSTNSLKPLKSQLDTKFSNKLFKTQKK
jgi:Spy/CpxP family protein refolding chaperone